MDLPVSRLLQDLDAGRRRLSEVCTAAVRQDGAQALYLGSMTLGTLGVEAALQASLGVPVFNPFPIAIAAALQLAGSQPGSL
jgi:Asp/Glu/hydantoin racemase